MPGGSRVDRVEALRIDTIVFPFPLFAWPWLGGFGLALQHVPDLLRDVVADEGGRLVGVGGDVVRPPHRIPLSGFPVVEDCVVDVVADVVDRAVFAPPAVAPELGDDAVDCARIFRQAEDRFTLHLVLIEGDARDVEERGGDVGVPGGEAVDDGRAHARPEHGGVHPAHLSVHEPVVAQVGWVREAGLIASVSLLQVLAVVCGHEDHGVLEEAHGLPKGEPVLDVHVELRRIAVVRGLHRGLAGRVHLRVALVPPEVVDAPCPPRALRGGGLSRRRAPLRRPVEGVVRLHHQHDEEGVVARLDHPLRAAFELLQRGGVVHLRARADLDLLLVDAAHALAHVGDHVA